MSKPNNALFDALGVDESAGIDADEIKAIQQMLERMRIEAAQVAKVNDAATTIEVLTAMVTVVRKVGSVTSVDELHQVLATLGSGTAMTVAPTSTAPAAAPVGTATALTDNEQRLVDLFRSASTGQQQAIIRVMNTADPACIRVDSTGAPVMIAQLQQAWDDDHDVNHASSQAALIHDLQQQLAARALPGGATMVPKADLDAAQATAQAHLDALTKAKADVKAQVAKLELDSAESAGFGGKKTTIAVSPTVVRTIARELDGLTR